MPRDVTIRAIIPGEVLASGCYLAPAELKNLRQIQPSKMNVQHEVSLLVEEIQRLGSKNADGKTSVKFGVLFSDDRCANIFEALVGTLKAAKKKKIVTFEGELLLQGVHDNVDVILLQE